MIVGTVTLISIVFIREPWCASCMEVKGRHFWRRGLGLEKISGRSDGEIYHLAGVRRNARREQYVSDYPRFVRVFLSIAGVKFKVIKVHINVN